MSNEMTNHEGDVPAMPIQGQSFILGDTEHTPTCRGLSMRQAAALALRVPDSGTPWLDAMIRASLRAEFAKAAMQGLIANDVNGRVVPTCSVEYADKLLTELEKGR